VREAVKGSDELLKELTGSSGSSYPTLLLGPKRSSEINKRFNIKVSPSQEEVFDLKRLAFNEINRHCWIMIFNTR
jgi:hypothetical protein